MQVAEARVQIERARREKLHRQIAALKGRLALGLKRHSGRWYPAAYVLRSRIETLEAQLKQPELGL